MEKCEIRELYHFLGKRWSIQLMHILYGRSKSYNCIIRELRHEINPTLLSSRLKEMIRFGLLQKVREEASQRYEMTHAGRILLDILHRTRDIAKMCEYHLPEGCESSLCLMIKNVPKH